MDQLHQTVIDCQAKLTKLNLRKKPDPVKVTHARGQLLRALKKEYKRSPEGSATKNAALAELRVQSTHHAAQLTERKDKNKTSPNHSISREIGLKLKKANAIRNELVYSQNKKAAAVNVVRLVGQTVTTALSTLKYPVVALGWVADKSLPYIGAGVGKGMQLTSEWLHKKINPSSPYNGQHIADMGLELGKAVGSSAVQIAKTAKRM